MLLGIHILFWENVCTSSALPACWERSLCPTPLYKWKTRQTKPRQLNALVAGAGAPKASTVASWNDTF